MPHPAGALPPVEGAKIGATDRGLGQRPWNRFAFTRPAHCVGEMPRLLDTIAALATPVGTSAIALLRVSGPDTARIAGEIFGVPPLPRTPRHADYRDRAGVVLDDVVHVFFPGPRSYTAEDTLELSCHGNPFIAQRVLEDLLARGCRAAEPGEFTQRAFLNGRIDLSQAEAVMDLVQARSERALEAANQQLRGALGRRIQAASGRLLQVLARVEAYIDFPDEDLPPEDRSQVVSDVTETRREIGQLLATGRYGAILRDGIRTVIVGAPNAGKSSLLNRLVGFDRALVSPEPGTTRDFIEERVSVGPHGLRLIDTAGLNSSPAPLEKLGIQKTLERARQADLFIVVEDAGIATGAVPPEIQPLVTAANAIVVANKIDLPHPVFTPETSDGIRRVGVSARTGAGIDELIRLIVSRADSFLPQTTGDLVAIGARHSRALEEASTGLALALEKAATASPAELLASDLRSALQALGEIQGRFDNERMLDELFASFCIGK